MKRRETFSEVGVVAQSEPSKTGEDEQGRAWRQHCKIRSLDLEAVNEVEASFDTMEGFKKPDTQQKPRRVEMKEFNARLANLRTWKSRREQYRIHLH